MDTPPPGEPVIWADGLAKCFKIYPSPWGRAAEWISLGHVQRHDNFWALRKTNFTVNKGEALGVIGVNGSGKSTLLKILSGALYPTEGTFKADGRVLSLLELGTGVNPLLTGRQNVLTSSSLLDFPADYAERKMPEIEAFADLPAGFFDRPVGLYSSGMLVRLVFSMFACFDPDIFIVDEALSVGDVFFQQKCTRRLQEMRAGGTTMLFVSHDLAAVEALCDRVMVLHQGTVRHLGDKMTGIKLYYALSGAVDERSGRSGGVVGLLSDAAATGRDGDDKSSKSPTATPNHPTTQSPPLHPLLSTDVIGDGRVRITGIGYERDNGGDEPVVRQAEWLTIVARIEAAADVGPINFGLDVTDRFDRVLFARGWVNADIEPMHLLAGQSVLARCRIKLDLEPGEYPITLAVSEALKNPAAANGWDQDVGGQRHAVVKGAGKVAILPRTDGRRTHYGQSPLESELEATILQ